MQVLDDNRELFIPETQQLVKAHSQFLLFGTQNPPGSYGGRKVTVLQYGITESCKEQTLKNVSSSPE